MLIQSDFIYFLKFHYVFRVLFKHREARWLSWKKLAQRKRKNNKVIKPASEWSIIDLYLQCLRLQLELFCPLEVQKKRSI